jgi:flagellar hook assembly protein FlgD
VQASGAGSLTLSVVDCRGSSVKSFDRAGAGSIEWDRKDGAGREVSPGVYMVRATGSGVSLSTSFTLPR